MVRERPKMMTPFETWVQDEGLKVITAHTIKDIATEELAPWEKTGCDGALLDLTHDPDPNVFINNQGTIRYLVEIPPGGTFKAERHMYEEIFYVAKGRGATVVWYDGSPKHTFEWQEDSAFAIPLNAWHELYNGSGTDVVRLYAASNMPTPINLYGSPEFVFNCANTFPERFDPMDELYFSGKTMKLGDRLTQSNFIPSVLNMTLDNWSYRGPGTNMYVLMAGGRFVCHVSEFPVGSVQEGPRVPGIGRRRLQDGAPVGDELSVPQRRRVRPPVAARRQTRARHGVVPHRLQAGLADDERSRRPSALQRQRRARQVPRAPLRQHAVRPARPSPRTGPGPQQPGRRPRSDRVPRRGPAHPGAVRGGVRQAGRGLRDALAGLSQPRPHRRRRACWGTSEQLPPSVRPELVEACPEAVEGGPTNGWRGLPVFPFRYCLGNQQLVQPSLGPVPPRANRERCDDHDEQRRECPACGQNDVAP